MHMQSVYRPFLLLAADISLGGCKSKQNNVARGCPTYQERSLNYPEGGRTGVRSMSRARYCQMIRDYLTLVYLHLEWLEGE